MVGGGPCFVNSTHDNCGRGRSRRPIDLFTGDRWLVGVIKPGDKTGTHEENCGNSSTAKIHLGMVHFMENKQWFLCWSSPEDGKQIV